MVLCLFIESEYMGPVTFWEPEWLWSRSPQGPPGLSAEVKMDGDGDSDECMVG